MSLPASYSNNFTKYFEDLLFFFEKFQWIFSTSNVNLLKENVLAKIPEKWFNEFIDLNNEEFNSLPFNYIKDTWPSDLKAFFIEINNLKPLYADNSITLLTVKLNNNQMRGINVKKLHEINNLTKLINENLCTENPDKDTISVFIDLGSGLGYLTQYLYEMNNNIRILGLESDGERVEAAKKRQKLYYPHSHDNVKYLQHFITENSLNFINESIRKLFYLNDNQYKLYVIGLHSCADLSVIAIKLFLESEVIKQLFVMPCCYHKMQLANGGPANFVNIPLSNCLKAIIVKNKNYEKIISRPFLRLACQRSSAKWRNTTQEEHASHGFNSFHRGVIELALSEDRFLVTRDGTKLEPNTFWQYYTAVKKSNKDNKFDWTVEQRKILNDYKKLYPDGDVLAEIHSCLQVCLQSICENLVLLDRICFVEEQNINLVPDLLELTVDTIEISEKTTTQTVTPAPRNKMSKLYARVEKITNDELSPRCFALVVERI